MSLHYGNTLVFAEDHPAIQESLLRKSAVFVVLLSIFARFPAHVAARAARMSIYGRITKAKSAVSILPVLA